MAQKIKLELTEREAKILYNALNQELAELVRMVNKTTAAKDYLFQKHLLEKHEIGCRVLGLLKEPYLV